MIQARSSYLYSAYKAANRKINTGLSRQNGRYRLALYNPSVEGREIHVFIIN